jgi:hypothetical protein
MTRYLVSAYVAATSIIGAVTDRLSFEDDGAVTTETAIITAILAGVAVTTAMFIGTQVEGWRDAIPGGGG